MKRRQKEGPRWKNHRGPWKQISVVAGTVNRGNLHGLVEGVLGRGESTAEGFLVEEVEALDHLGTDVAKCLSNLA